MQQRAAEVGGRRVRIGTRGSALALRQAALVQRAIADRGAASELVIIQTEGDRRAPDTAWGEGAFVSAIERALRDGRIDVAVHSAKDIPTDEDARLLICAYLPREEPRDALVVGETANGATLETLPAGTVVGTDSPRRTGFLRAFRPDLVVRPLHGNVDTRLRRLAETEVGALIVAAAGLIRLGRADRIAQLVPESIIPPAPGQGALAVQVRADDRELIDLATVLDDRPTRLAVELERHFLAETGGGCRAPIGALATLDSDGHTLSLLAGFASTDGRFVAFDQIETDIGGTHDAAAELATRLVCRRAELSDAPRVLVTRPANQAARLTARLVEHGLAPVVVPTISIELVPIRRERLGGHEWVVATSTNAIRSIRELGDGEFDVATVRWAVVGDATARELAVLGAADDPWRPSATDSATLGRELPLSAGDRVLLLAGSLDDGSLAEILRQRGATIDVLTVYRTVEAPTSSQSMLEWALAGAGLAAVIVASPSQVRGLLALAGDERKAEVLGLPAVCIGATTARAATAAGFSSVATASSPAAEAVAELAAAVVARQPMEVRA